MTASPDHGLPGHIPPEPPASTATSSGRAGSLLYSSGAQTARLTLASVMLGALLGVLVTGLPPSPSAFATSVLNGQHLTLDLQVVAMVLFFLNLWLAYSWFAILQLAPFDFYSNLHFFSLVLLGVGMALSVSDFRAWFAWMAAIVVLVMVNAVVVWLDRSEAMSRAVLMWRLRLYVAGSLAFVYGALNAYGVLPSWARFPISPLVWVVLITAFVIVDIVTTSVFLQKVQRSIRT